MNRTIKTISAAVSATVVSLVYAATVSGGTYTATQCSAAYGVGAPDAQAFDVTGANNRYREEDYCSSESQGGGLVAYRHPDAGAAAGGTTAGWFFAAPPNTRLTAINVLASGATGPDQDVFPELLARSPVFGSSTANLGFASPIGSETTYSWSGETDAFTLQMRCSRPEALNCRPESGNFINVRQINLTLSDGSAPQVADAGSSLNRSASQRGTLGASYAASDQGAGVRSVIAEVNGIEVATAAQACSVTQGRAVRLAPCPGSASGSISLDTTQAPWQQGLNRTRFCAIEFADANAGTVCSAGPDVRVDNQCPVNGTQDVVGFEQVRFEGRKAGDGVTTYGRGVKMTGKAVNADDQPVAGAQLCLGERNDLGPYTPESIVRMATTNAKGRFTIGVPSGPSRVFRLAQWQASGAVVEQFSALQVRAKPRLAVRPKGRIREGKKTRLRVNVNRPFAPGQTVEIQARAPTGFVGLPGCSGEVDADGRFTCRDRIPPTPGQAAYALQYRAVAPHVEGSAYLGGTSKVITKRVKG